MKKRKILWEKVRRYSGILLLTVFAFLVIVGVPVFAEGEEDTTEAVAFGNLSEYGNDNINWTLTADGTLTITGQGDLPSWWTGITTPIEVPEPEQRPWF